MNTPDFTHIYDLFKGDKSIATEVLSILKKNIIAEVRQMNQYLIEEKWEKLALAAHTLKSQMNYIACKSTVELLKKVEAYAKKHSHKDLIRSLSLEIFENCRLVSIHLEKELNHQRV